MIIKSILLPPSLPLTPSVCTIAKASRSAIQPIVKPAIKAKTATAGSSSRCLHVTHHKETQLHLLVRWAVLGVLTSVSGSGH